jgi:hypothetical protein
MVLYNQGDPIKCSKSISKIELFYLAVNFIYHSQRSLEHACICCCCYIKLYQFSSLLLIYCFCTFVYYIMSDPTCLPNVGNFCEKRTISVQVQWFGGEAELIFKGKVDSTYIGHRFFIAHQFHVHRLVIAQRFCEKFILVSKKTFRLVQNVLFCLYGEALSHLARKVSGSDV